ncbi:hypothetical protein [Enterococcus timonensis]|uniref:hypothetical protein n=1 Tax=Enterococcus timonensis TaxID=1852364 RepID=UPI0008D933CD|nr:hypothetical protein [Enterococcus timonensis]
MQFIIFPKEVSFEYSVIDDLLRQINSLESPVINADVCFDFKSTTWLNADLTPFLGNLALNLAKNGYKLYSTNFGSNKVNSILKKNGFLKKHGIGELEVDFYGTTMKYNIFQSEAFIDIDSYLDKEVFDKIHKLNRLH